MQLTLKNQIPLGNCDFYGFASAQHNIKNSLELSGVRLNSCSKKTLSHIGAHLFEPDGRKNFLWFPYEADKINPGIVEKINRADHVIASCEHNKNVFEKNGVKKPISVCKLGIDTDTFKSREHIKKTNRFRFLWIGNPIDMRKGWDVASQAFVEEFGNDHNVELYLKTTGKNNQDLATLGANVIFDSRNLAIADLLDLYESSHVLVMSSRGEATGLPALEAMSMELLVMAPPIQGMTDFILPHTSIQLDYEMVDGNYGIDMKFPEVIIKNLKQEMRKSFNSYGESLEIRKNAREFVIKNHSLKSMGERLVEIIFH